MTETQRRRLVRQRARRVRDRIVQNGGHSAAWTLAWPRGRRVRHARLGVLVQHATTPGADRVRSPGRVRGPLLSEPPDSRHGGGSQLNRSPGNPGRFITAKKFRLRSCSSYVLSSHVARCSPASTCQNDGAALACFLPPTRWEALIVAATPDSTGGHDGSGSTTSAPPAALLAQLNRSTDLAWLVERVCRNNLPWVVVPGSALTAWQQRDPAGWEKVSAWLGAKGITIVRI
jgi:hypothetical protein